MDKYLIRIDAKNNSLAAKTSELPKSIETTVKEKEVLTVVDYEDKNRKVNNNGVENEKRKRKKPGGLTLEQHRRRLGDAVKDCLSMEKYCMKADCHCTVKISIDTFRRLIIPHAAEVTPVQFTSTTPVVVALVKGSKAAGEIFGKSKIKGGNRYEQCEAEKMELVFFPSREKMRIWWIMYRDYRSKDSEDDE